MNMTMGNYDETVEHFTKMYDATMVVFDSRLKGPPRRMSELPYSAVGNRDRMQALFRFGGAMFAAPAPKVMALHTRPGRVWAGVEYKVDLAAARQAVAERGIGIIIENSQYFITDPLKTYGLHFEFFPGDFTDDKPATYWRDEHPAGMTGMKGYTVAVGASDLEGAARMFEELLSGKRLYQEDRPGIGARAIGLRVADSFVEVLAPTGNGVLRRHLERRGRGIYSVVMGVRDLDQIKRYMAGKGVQLGSGTAPTRLAAPAEANLDLVFEFQV